jgi:hypothetical protein
VRAAAVEDARKLNHVIHGYRAELSVRRCAGIRPQAEDRGVLVRERLREGGAVAKIRVQYLDQFGVRDAERPPADSRNTFDGGVFKCIAQGVSADHSGCAHEDKMCPACGRNAHDNVRFSTQST